MARLVLLVFGLCAVATAAEDDAFKRQFGDPCAAITANIGNLDCSESTVECLESATATGLGSVAAIQQLICPATELVRTNIYDVLVSCEGQVYADTVYAGLCGSTTIAGDPVICTDAILSVNNGTSAKQACCGLGNASQCASELQQLSADLGCCTATIVLQLFLAECEDGQGLPALFQANGVTPPPLCDYPLYEPGSGDGSGDIDGSGDGSGGFGVAASVASVSIGVVCSAMY
jgi:hypothetical protein